MIENKNKELYKDGEKTYKKEIWVVSLMSRANKADLMSN